MSESLVIADGKQTSLIPNPSATMGTKAKKATPAKNDIVKKVEQKKGKKVIAKIKPNVKVIRDSFTMPQSDYSILGELKLACIKEGLEVKKSELLRAGLFVLSKLSVAQLVKTVEQLEHIKTGRPKNK